MKKRMKMMLAVAVAMVLGVVGIVEVMGTANAANAGKTANAKKAEVDIDAILEKVGLESADVHDVKRETDVENGRRVYEIEFESGGYEYDYVLDAETEEVIWSEKEKDDDAGKKKSESKPAEKNTTTKSDKKQKEKKAEVKEEVKPEAQKEEQKAEVKPEAQKEEQKAEVKPEAQKEEQKAEVKPESKPAEKKETTKKATEDIGKEKAKAIALQKAGVSAGSVSRLRVERDYDDGRLEYNVEFDCNGKEYEVEISGSSGKILDYDVERADNDQLLKVKGLVIVLFLLTEI